MTFGIFLYPLLVTAHNRFDTRAFNFIECRSGFLFCDFATSYKSPPYLLHHVLKLPSCLFCFATHIGQCHPIIEKKCWGCHIFTAPQRLSLIQSLGKTQTLLDSLDFLYTFLVKSLILRRVLHDAFDLDVEFNLRLSA